MPDVRRPLRIGIDARLPSVRSGGISEYTVELVAALAAIETDDEFLVFHAADDPEVRVPRGAARVTRADLRTPCHHPYERVMLAAELAPHRLDVFHSPDFIPPSSGTARRVITVHDLAFLAHPEWMNADGRRHYGAQIAIAAAQADAIACVSRHTRDDLLRRFPVSPAKVVTTPLAASARYRATPDAAQLSATLARHDLSPGYVLFVGTLEPRKNVETLLRAHASLAHGDSEDVPLVLVGEPGWLVDGLRAVVERAGRRVRRLGRVPSDDLVRLYQGAGVLAMPSITEGFGLPVIEAMQAGCPVVCSTGGALPETAGSAAVLVEPLDVEGWTSALRGVLLDPSLAQSLQARGRERAAQFSWAATALATLALYRQAASGAAPAPGA